MAEPHANDTPPRTESDAYQQTRKAFQDLGLEEKALFLVEATTSTLLRGLEAFTREMTSQFEEAFTPPDAHDEASDAHEASDAEAAHEHEAAAEEASEKKSEKEKAKKTTSKKKAASKKGKKTSRKKKSDDT